MACSVNAATPTVTRADIRRPEEPEMPCHLKIALTQVGVRELTGNNDGEEVAMYLASTGITWEAPWCGAFPHWCYRMCGTVLEPKMKFALASYWHIEEKRIWERSKGDTAHAMPGDHGSLYYTDPLNRIGHEYLIEYEAEGIHYTVEGNTNLQGDREGQGVERRKRMKRTAYTISRW